MVMSATTSLAGCTGSGGSHLPGLPVRSRISRWADVLSGLVEPSGLTETGPGNEVMSVELLTRGLKERLPPLGATENEPAPMVRCKFFYPDFHYTWYAIEYDGQDLFFGWVDGDFPELGYFSMSELKANRGRLGCRIERDRWFRPCRLSELRDEPHRWVESPTLDVGSGQPGR